MNCSFLIPEPWHEAVSEEGHLKNFVVCPPLECLFVKFFTRVPFVLVETLHNKQFWLLEEKGCGQGL